MGYGMTTRVREPFAETVERVRAALKDQEMEDYLILGACNPPLAHRALGIDRQIGLLLPCNVVVRSDGGDTVVEALDPQVMVSVSGQPAFKPVAEEAAGRLAAALDTLRP